MRIKRLFHSLHHRVAFFTDHELEELTAQAAIAVFAGKGAAIFFHESGDIGGDIAKHFQTFAGLEIKERSRVEFPGSGMRVVDTTDLVFVAHE